MTSSVITDPPRPGTAAHRQLITASKVPSILGIDPFKSRFALWHEMHGDIEPPPISKGTQQIFDWGHSAELAMADYWKKQNPGWTLNGGEIAFTNDALPFPNLVTLDELAAKDGVHRVLEFKTANSYQSTAKWGKPGEKNSAPANYLAQHIFQRGVSGIHDGQVILQSMGRPEFHDVTWDAVLWSRIVVACTEFWKSLETHTPPSPDDDTTATYDAIRGLHPEIAASSEWSVPSADAERLLQADADVKEATSRLKTEKNKLLGNMGEAQYATIDGYRVAGRQAGRGKHPILVVKGKIADLPRQDDETESLKEDNE